MVIAVYNFHRVGICDVAKKPNRYVQMYNLVEYERQIWLWWKNL